MKKEIPKRPKWDEKMLTPLAEIMGKDLNTWCNNDTPLEDCVDTVKEVLKFHADDNGYEIAKAFEDHGFMPDRELVDLMEKVIYVKHNIEKESVVEWVMLNSLELDHSVGDNVVVMLNFGGDVDCEITKLYPETLQYGVWHKGMRGEKGKRHLIINQEDILTQ